MKYDVKLPVVYEINNFRIVDAKRQVICKPWQTTGMRRDDIKELGEFIADAINAYSVPTITETVNKTIGEKITDVKNEIVAKVSEGVYNVVETVSEEVKKKRGRPAKVK